jgi:hypothetical protein
VATKPEAETAAENGKPSKNSPAPVIRRLVVAEEDARTRLMNRQMPAIVISGLINCLLIFGSYAIFKLLETDPKDLQAKDAVTSTKMDEPPPKEPDLTNPDTGLDSELEAAVEVDREADVNVEAPVVENEATGLANQDKEFAPQTAQLGAVNDNFATGGTPGDSDLGTAMKGDNGAGSQLALPGMQGRSGATKEKNLRAGGGNDETEAAVGRALAWIAKQQTPSGFWEYDGSHKADRIAATGMAILPFLAAGETHLTGKKYRTTVYKGLEFLKKEIKANGQFGASGMYAQAIAAIAVCEAAGMTQDDKLKKVAKLATDFIVKAQAGNGSWGYTASTEGDTSIVGWQVQALKSAKLAGIAIPEKAMAQADSFLVSVSDESESGYGYRTKGSTYTLSSVGLLSRMYIKNISKGPWIARGVKSMWTDHKPTEGNWDMYYYYYATQVVHFFDGADWHQNWNPTMRKILLDKQMTVANGAKPADIGSFPKDSQFIGSSCGKLGTTCLACLTLEVYYRHLPLGKRDAAGGLNELEGKNK